jgi:hypothetical protein
VSGNPRHPLDTLERFTGPRDALLEDVASFENSGLNVFIPSLIAPGVEELVDNCEAFAEAMGIG